MLGVTQHTEIVNMDGENDNTGGIMAIIDTVLTIKTFKVSGDELCMKCFVPDTPALFHAIETPLQLPNMVLKTRLDKPFWLLHVADLIRLEDTIEKGGLDVQLFDLPIECSTKMGQGMEGFHVYSGGSGFCRITPADIPSFEAGQVPMLIPFKAKIGAPAHDMATHRNGGARDQAIDIELLEKRELRLQSVCPFGGMWRCHGLLIGVSVFGDLGLGRTMDGPLGLCWE
jgi:hypothetical protein